jgi:response regulator of citrate/malate metabolism
MAMRTLARPGSGAARQTAPDPIKTGVTQATLEALTRLNDKSTQRMAAEELEGLVQAGAVAWSST